MSDFDPTKPAGLRGDENIKVTILAKDLNNPTYQIVIQYQDESGQDNVGLRLRNGRIREHGTESKYDLVNVPSRIPFWIIKSANHFGMYTTVRPDEHATAEWRGPFYMDEDGNPVSGDE